MGLIIVNYFFFQN